MFDVLPAWGLNLSTASMSPLIRMLNNACPHHIHIDEYYAAQQMISLKPGN
jgi:hypothetical protein